MWYKLCDVVMLKTDIADNAIIKTLQDTIKYYDTQYFTQTYLDFIDCKSYHLYITSNDKILPGDPYISRSAVQIASNEYKGSKGDRKIICTTDKHLKVRLAVFTITTSESTEREASFVEMSLPMPSIQFMSTFVNEHNDGNTITKVYVKYMNVVPQSNGRRSDGKIIDEISLNPVLNTLQVPILNYSYNIIEPIIKYLKTSWSETEVVDLLHKVVELYQSTGFVSWEAFIQDNLHNINDSIETQQNIE